MSKFVIAKQLSISIVNHKGGRPVLYVTTPVSYTLFDIIQMIKMYGNYDDRFDWTFYHVRKEIETLSLQKNEAAIKNTKYADYRAGYPGVICTYGSMIMRLGMRGSLKYRKSYPTFVLGIKKFPSEEAFQDTKKYRRLRDKILKKISVEINTTMQTEKYAPEDAQEFQASLTNYFKHKYKIGGELKPSFFGEEYELQLK